MAGTAQSVHLTGIAGSDVRQLVIEHNSLVSDAEALRGALASALSQINVLVTLTNELKADFNGHTHRGDGAQVGQYNTSGPQSDAATVAAVTARSVVAADSVAVASTTVDAANDLVAAQIKDNSGAVVTN